MDFFIYLIILYFIIAIFAYFFSEKIIFQPPSNHQPNDNIIKITTENNIRISAIYLPNPKATYTVLINHGNAENLNMMFYFFQEFYQHGFSVFAYDYAGYGSSEGKPSEMQAYQDADAAYHYLISQLQLSPDKIIIYGRSLGAALAIDLASRKSAAGVIIQSPFLTAFRTLTFYPILPFDKFKNLPKVNLIKSPILVMHGTRDCIVPFWHGQKLYQYIQGIKYHYWVKGAGHNDLNDISGDLYWQNIDKFVKQLAGGATLR